MHLLTATAQPQRARDRTLWVLPFTVLVVVALRAVISARGFLYADDFAFRYWAATEPLDWAYLTRSYGGHLNPVGLTAQWVLQALFPGSHLALVLLVSVLSAGTMWLAGRTMVLLTGRWQAGVMAVVLLGVGLFTFENTTWWAGAIYAAPYQLFLAAALYFLVRALMGDGGVFVWAVLLAFLGMAGSYSRGVLAALLLLGVAAAIPVSGAQPLGLRPALRWQPRLWAGIAVISVASVSLSAIAASAITRPGLSLGSALRYAWQLLVLNVLPGLWGGPWRWFDVRPQDWHAIVQNPAPPWWAVWLCVFATGVAIVWIVRYRPVVRTFLPWAAAFAVLAVAIVAIARAGTFVESVAYRYTFDIAWPFMLIATLCVIPMWWQDDRVPTRWWIPVSLFSASALVSTLVPATNWMSNQGREYVDNAIAGSERLPDDYLMLAQGVPEDLIEPSLMRPYANTRTVLLPQPGSPIFGNHAHGILWGFDDAGRLQEQDVQGPASLPGPDPDCGYRVTDRPRSIPLDGRLINWAFVARIAYFTGTPTSLNVAVGGRVHSVPLRAEGLDAVFLPVTGPGTDILVSVGTPGAVACVSDVRIGNRVDAEGELVPAPLEGELVP